MTDLPDHPAFARHVGETFVIRPPEGEPLEVELVEALALAVREDVPEGVRKEPFSLLFRAQVQDALPQQIYRIEHGTLGDLDLFLVPLGPDTVGMRYEAVFS